MKEIKDAVIDVLKSVDPKDASKAVKEYVENFCKDMDPTQKLLITLAVAGVVYGLAKK